MVDLTQRAYSIWPAWRAAVHSVVQRDCERNTRTVGCDGIDFEATEEMRCKSAVEEWLAATERKFIGNAADQAVLLIEARCAVASAQVRNGLGVAGRTAA